MSETIIQTKKLGCQAGHRYLLKDINWEVKKGQHWVVFGMNGSGKTTLLSIIAGFKTHTHGNLEVFGEPYSTNNVLSLRKRIGWVSSSFFDKYYTKESALQIVLSGLFGTFAPGYEVTDEQVVLAKILLGRLGLGDKIDRPFNMMSKGERQNVLIARALIASPEILVLDEPGTGLDVFAREYMLSIVRELADETGVTIIYVTHYPEEILDIFQNCLLLKHGRIYAKGRTDELMTSERLSAFLEYPVKVTKQVGKMQIDLTVKAGITELLQGKGVQ